MVTPKQMRPALRCDILCVLVIESTQHMQNLFPDLYDSVLTKIITQLRTPVIVDSPGKKDAAAKKGSQPTKATPCVRLGVVFFGDYYPYSTRTRSTKYFTSNYREFAKTIKEHRFCEGGRLRCAATEGLVGALEMFDDFNEFDPEAGLTSVQQRHVILVSSTPPYAEPCRENDHMRYDGFGLDSVADRMRELKLSFSLVQERGKRIEQVENLLKAANVSTKPALELPKSMSPSFDVRLAGIDLPIPQEFATAALTATQPTPVALQPQTSNQLSQAPVHIQPAQNPAMPQQSVSLPQKNKVDTSAMAVDLTAAAAAPKKQRTEAEVPNAGATADDQAKLARAKSRPKNPSAPRPKAPRASNSPATATVAAPAMPQANVAGAAFLAATGVTGQNPNAVNGGMANPPSVPQHQLPPGHPMLQQQQGGNPAMASSSMQPSQPPAQAANAALNPSVLNIKKSLIAQGITSDAHHQIIIDMFAQCQNPAKSPEEKMLLKQQLEVALIQMRQSAAAQAATAQDGAQPVPQAIDTSAASTAAVARTISHQSSASTPQQQQQQQQQGQGMVSPPMQPGEQPPAAVQQLLQQALHTIRNKQNVDLRHLLSVLTPDMLEANIRDACRDQPDIINNVAALKFAYAQLKAAQQLKQQQQLQQLAQQQQQQQHAQHAQQQQAQQHLATQNAQLASPNGMQAANAGQQGHPTPVQAAAQGPNTLWRGTLVWESTPSNNIKHESVCQIAAFALQGINYTAQELNLGEWPDQLRVKLMVEANVGFVENCIRSGIQMVRIGPSPNADQDTLKYFEDFSSKMREKSYYALANAGTMKPTFPFAGIILTNFKNHLVGLPFFNRHISEAVMQLLQQHTLPSAAHHQQPGANAGAQQMTSQPVASGMSAPGAINPSTAAAILARNASLASAAQQTAAQQIMSPQQSMAVRPNLSSPGVASPVPNHLQGFANLLQNRLTHEQMEAIWSLPSTQRDATITMLLGQAMAARQIPPQLQAQLAMQQQQQMAQFQQVSHNQQFAQQFQQASNNQQLAQLLANQQLMQQQHMMGNLSGLNPAMFSAAGQQGGMTAFSNQPPNSQQLMPNQLIQQQQQQQQHRPS
ncbi:hypothetical protein GGI13_003759 [Coemansia sp. RSA 455]|nr:hypothetical protein GGI13_003759 [Coemansia sp. RSA 455]